MNYRHAFHAGNFADVFKHAVLARILVQAGHRAIVASRAGRLVADVTAAGGEFVPIDAGTNNPIVMLRNIVALNRIARILIARVDAA